MKILQNKILAIAFAILLTISMSASVILIPQASAHTPGYQIPTFAYISVHPDPIGVGQSVNVFMWLNQIFGVGLVHLKRLCTIIQQLQIPQLQFHHRCSRRQCYNDNFRYYFRHYLQPNHKFHSRPNRYIHINFQLPRTNIHSKQR